MIFRLEGPSHMSRRDLYRISPTRHPRVACAHPMQIGVNMRKNAIGITKGRREEKWSHLEPSVAVITLINIAVLLIGGRKLWARYRADDPGRGNWLLGPFDLFIVSLDVQRRKFWKDVKISQRWNTTRSDLQQLFHVPLPSYQSIGFTVSGAEVLHLRGLRTIAQKPLYPHLDGTYRSTSRSRLILPLIDQKFTEHLSLVWQVWKQEIRIINNKEV